MVEILPSPLMSFLSLSSLLMPVPLSFSLRLSTSVPAVSGYLASLPCDCLPLPLP